MTDSVLLDNDVILKTCCYDAVDELIGCIAGKTRTMHALGVVRYVLARAIAKGKNIANKERAADRLVHLLGSVALIEPNDDELELAAGFEEAAQSRGVDLDGGESQLLAILIRRSAALLLTGDKRAICAMEPVVQARGYEEQVARRVACLEQIVMALIGRHGAETLHTRVCGESGIDISLAICFSCASGSFNPESIVEALVSYIRDLRRYAPSVLVDSDDLSTVIPQEDGIG
jgi:hypothetical protein